MNNDILEILKRTRDSAEIENISNTQIRLLQSFGAEESENNKWKVDRKIRIRMGMQAVTLGSGIESVVDHLTWKDFEGFIAGILEEHNYRCIESFRRRGNKLRQGMEIDVIGLRGDTLIVVDAKMWSVRAGKVSAIKTAAEKQLKRTERLCSEIDALSMKLGEMKPGSYSLVPMLVTWVIEDVELYEGIPIIPIFKFNSFILEYYKYEDMIASVPCIV